MNATPAPPAPPGIPTDPPADRLLTRHRFDVHAYRRMVEVGLLEEGSRIELIDGEIIDMTPVGPPHGGIVDRLNHHFAPGVAGRAIVRVQGSFELSRWSEPQPDLLLLAQREDFYGRALPTAGDVLLLIEVCDSSLRRDRTVKLPLYASADVREVWLIDVDGQRVEVYREPSDGAYGVRLELDLGDTAIPDALPDLGLAIDTLF